MELKISSIVLIFICLLMTLECESFQRPIHSPRTNAGKCLYMYMYVCHCNHPDELWCILSLIDRILCYQPRSEGDNVLGSVRPSVYLFGCIRYESHYQSKVFVCVSVISGRMRIIVQMQSISCFVTEGPFCCSQPVHGTLNIRLFKIDCMFCIRIFAKFYLRV